VKHFSRNDHSFAGPKAFDTVFGLAFALAVDCNNDFFSFVLMPRNVRTSSYDVFEYRRAFGTKRTFCQVIPDAGCFVRGQFAFEIPEHNNFHFLTLLFGYSQIERTKQSIVFSPIYFERLPVASHTPRDRQSGQLDLSAHRWPPFGKRHVWSGATLELRLQQVLMTQDLRAAL
jgi:hypothetical protein